MLNEFALGLAFAASVFMGVSIGASTVASAFGPVNSSGGANVLRSAMLAGIFALTGAIFQGGNTTRAVGSNLLAGEIQVIQAAIILSVAASLVIISVLGDYPMPTAFTVIGAVIGSGLGVGNAVNWGVLMGVIGYWLLIPPLAAGMSYFVAKVLRSNVSRQNYKREIRLGLLVAGCYLSYSAGASAVGLAVGPLTGNFSLSLLLATGGLAMLLGTWIYSPRIIRAISFDYSNVGPRRSFAALVTASVLAQIGIFYGIPISFNEAIIAAMIGSGLVRGTENTDHSKILRTAGAWMAAFLLSAVLTYGITLLV
ncbi:anion permease [Candidatus Nanohalococcus occultus]|uniref:inorganic phosphate transporter n=1 Tax=Candidatus Nanohalococcus occultus TaxID=2978047 RepID=UPI0039DF9E70